MLVRDLGLVFILLLRVIEVALICAVVYHYLFVVASAVHSSPRIQTAKRQRRFALVIPAHNEEMVIARTLECTRSVDYPSDHYDVVVIADHCTDQTASRAEELGAIVHIRAEEPSGRKGYALAWGFERLIVENPPYDAFVVLDADSLIDSDFLNAINIELETGPGVLQGQRVVNNAQDSILAAIAAVDQRLNNRLRNQARTNLGLSCRLMGDAMVFARDVLEAVPWKSDSLVEDREYGAELLRKGIRARYVPEALVRQQAAVEWKSGQQQRLRWYRGAVEIQKRIALLLIKDGLLGRDWAQIDGGIELLMPSFSILIALTLVVALVESFLLPSSHRLFVVPINLALLAWIAYPFLGLWTDRAPASMYKASLFGPLYIVWRVWLSLLTRILGKRIKWIRTQRREESQELSTERA